MITQVASGVPRRNGSLHVQEICRMALALQKLFPALKSGATVVTEVSQLHLRVGIHTGAYRQMPGIQFLLVGEKPERSNFLQF